VTPKEREWLTDYVAMMKSNLAIHPGITLMGHEMNMGVIDRIVEVQIALNADAGISACNGDASRGIPHLVGCQHRTVK
jgi:hypothetical protein